MLKKQSVIKDLFSLSFSYIVSLDIWLINLWRECFTHIKNLTSVIIFITCSFFSTFAFSFFLFSIVLGVFSLFTLLVFKH